jgi:hypothetical protein
MLLKTSRKRRRAESYLVSQDFIKKLNEQSYITYGLELSTRRGGWERGITKFSIKI